MSKFSWVTCTATLGFVLILGFDSVPAQLVDRTTASRVLEDLNRNSRPAPHPVPDPDRKAPPGPGKFLTHDTATGTTLETDAPILRMMPDHDATPEYEGSLERFQELLETNPDLAKNFNAWTMVADPTSGNYPRRVRIWSSYLDTEGIMRGSYTCSGTLIDSRHVITAAHCIFQLADTDSGWTFPGGWAATTTVSAAYNNSTNPFGTADKTQLHAWSNFTIFQDYDHDIAVITLDRHIGALTGWYGYGYNEDEDYYLSGTFRHEGYPAEAPNFDGETMWENAGNFDESPVPGWDYRISFNMPSWGGSSGSGAERGGVVYAVASGSDRMTITEDVTLSSTKFGHVGGWINAVTPVSYDLLPMWVQADATVEAGQSLANLAFVIHNYSLASVSNSWPYTVYLSTDSTIGPGDTILDTGSGWASLGPKDSQWIDHGSIFIPVNTPPGDYFIGVYLNVTDFAESNNGSSGQEASPLTVECTAAPATPILTTPANGAVCRPRQNLYLAWSDAGIGDEYQIQVGTSPGSGQIYFEEDQNHTYVSGLSASTNYYWRVRGRQGCSEWSGWSTSKTFRTEANPNVVADAVFPAPDQHCLPAQVTMQWTPLPDANTYDLQIGSDCYNGTTYTGISNPLLILSNLTPGTEYFWRVRARTICGQTTDWSNVGDPCWTFKTEPTSIAAPNQIVPLNNDSCASGDPYLLWGHIEDWDSYEVQFGTACGTGTIYQTSSNGYQINGLQQGVQYFWRVRGLNDCAVQSPWSSCRSFWVDTQPPSNPSQLNSNSHTVGVWSTDNTVDVWWDFGVDACNGMPEYGTVWDQASDTQPVELPLIWFPEETFETSAPLPDGQDHWFHLRSVDLAQNWAPTSMHLGPFWIDATPPQEITDLTACEPVNVYGDYPTLTARWSPVTDNLSGLAGYSHVLDDSPPPNNQPDGIPDIALSEATVQMGTGIWTYRVIPLDQAGNSGSIVEIGPFLSQAIYPEIYYPECGDVLSEGETVTVTWEPYNQGLSGQLNLSLDGGQTFGLQKNLTSEELAFGQTSWLVPGQTTDEAVLQLGITTAFNFFTAAGRLFSLRAVAGIGNDVPVAGIVLEDNYPNPFNPSTTLAFSLDRAGTVRLAIHDAAGLRLRTLVDGLRGPGRHEVIWDGRTDQGRVVPSGVYYYRLTAAGVAQTRSMVLLK